MIEVRPYSLMSEFALRRAYKKHFKEVQRLVQLHYVRIAEDPRREMKRIVEEIEARREQR